ncbi:MAG TPA: 4-hydroxy-tetrahydrodipicolinate reductase [Candidatus Cloacimonas sp.]|jgi:4-hydroxy-tetrahydrodipicolinate reductase|nr:4-hydroxy-tetrahydrodipicolinate reductase [Candidatus Cloacimonadota bacterium]HCX72554.1 4-hydroxy-tetrahydrodipicolinate reductase [Candidatus Cloacimonas sp.]
MLKIALIGYGRMGKLLEQLASQNNCQVVAKIDPDLGNEINAENLKDAEVCIEFSTPTAVFSNIEKLIKLGKNIVVGTTGWQEQLTEVENIVTKAGTGLVFGSNFSVGMNLFFQINQAAAQLMNEVENYDVLGYEMHHNRKQDSPSGTAIKLGNILLENIARKKKLQLDRVQRKIEADELHFASLRGGDIPGTHSIIYDSVADSIELKHTARNRQGFALGALKAAHWIKDKQGCYDFTEVFLQLLG